MNQQKTKTSKFNVKAGETPGPGKTAVFNTLTRGLVILDSEVLKCLENGRDSGLNPAELKSLHDLGALSLKVWTRTSSLTYITTRYDSTTPPSR